MEKSKLYTKTGDKGETSLVDGSRVSKSSTFLELYGDVDELNSWLGLTYATALGQDSFQKLRTELDFLLKIQSELFVLGSNLACPKEARTKYLIPEISLAFIQSIEQKIDLLDSKVPALKNFILPGGSAVASHLNVCRTIARRVERKAVEVETAEPEHVGKEALMLLNRLSDYFFVLARFANQSLGCAEIHWAPKDKK